MAIMRNSTANLLAVQNLLAISQLAEIGAKDRQQLAERSSKQARLITFDDLSQYAAPIVDAVKPVAKAGLEAARKGVDAAGGYAMDMLESKSPFDVQQAAQQGRDLSAAVAAGQPSPLSLAPSAPMDWSARTKQLFNDPVAVHRMKLIGGGAVAGSLLTSVMRNYQEHKRRRIAMRELQRMGIKVSGWLEDVQAGGKRLYDSVGNAVTSAGLSSAANQAGSAINDRVQHFKQMIQQGLADPAKRPYVSAALGAAGAGGLAGVAELLSGRRKKRYMNSILSGMAAGGLVGGAYGSLTSPSSASSAPVLPSTAVDPAEQRQMVEQAVRSGDPDQLLKLSPEDREAALQMFRTVEQEHAPNALADLMGSHPVATGAAAGAGLAEAGALGADRYRWHNEMRKANTAMEEQLAKIRAAPPLDPVSEYDAILERDIKHNDALKPHTDRIDLLRKGGLNAVRPERSWLTSRLVRGGTGAGAGALLTSLPLLTEAAKRQANSNPAEANSFPGVF